MDVGEILVGSHRSIEIPLVNNSPCPVSFCLSVQQRLLGDELFYDPDTEPSGILFCCIYGCFLYLKCISIHYLYKEYLNLANVSISKLNELSSL